MILQFQSEGHGALQVLISTAKTAGVEMNLTATNKLFLMEPSWLLPTEHQCISRIRRIAINPFSEHCIHTAARLVRSFVNLASLRLAKSLGGWDIKLFHFPPQISSMI